MPSVSIASSRDIAIIGGGIVGLWTAFLAARQGLSVTLLEKRTIGAGASGGLLGALMPHQPTGWNAKKQFQLDGLLSLEAEIEAIESLTGMRAGYRRCGRLMPIRHAEKRRLSEQWVQASQESWPAPFRWQVTDQTPDPGWLPQDQMQHGANIDSLSARVDPRALVAALHKAVALSGIQILENTEVSSVENGAITLTDGSVLAAGRSILTAGWESFGLIDSLSGRGVKGQAALLRPARPVDPSAPILYDNGTYVIAHENGLVAIGSTSENEFDDTASTDEKLEAVIAHAMEICPALENAEIIERWAGIRPRADGREPLVGPLPGRDDLLVATGGFKISFAIAHLMARAALMQACSKTPNFLPDLFLPENRLKPRSG
ncbi:NAD(P)/FAD-dependent oxidoreductase [Oricola indica]|jgi:glycine oxidase|uniref:NAD(P)/FAD-dependent oxidoreductase n=1 Tax=Oricola indica TaxID=2872591 RepID=UPI001CBAC4DA|nr:FAD-dependent oxidoreductase [Oricola indica]